MRNSYMEADFGNLGATKPDPLFDGSFPENHMDDNRSISKFEEESIPSGYGFQPEHTLKEPISIDDWIQPWDPDGAAHQDALSFNLDSAINYDFDPTNTTNPVSVSPTAPVPFDHIAKESESAPLSVTPDDASRTSGVLRNGTMKQSQRKSKAHLTPEKEKSGSPISYPALNQTGKDIGFDNDGRSALATESLSSADGQDSFKTEAHSEDFEDGERRHQREMSTAYTMNYPLVNNGFNDTSAQHVNPHSIMKTPVRNAHRFLNMSPDLSSPNASFAGLESPLCSPSQNQSPFAGNGTFAESFPAPGDSKGAYGDDSNIRNFSGPFVSPRTLSTTSSSEGPSKDRSMSAANIQPSQASRARSIDTSVYTNEPLESQFTPTTPKSILQSRKQSIGTPKRTLTTVINDDHLADQALATPKSLAGNGIQTTPRTGKKDARRRIGKEQTEALENFYAINPKPERDDREKLADKTGLELRTVQIWFQNRRAKSRSMKNSMNTQDGINTENNIAIENSVAAQRAISASNMENKTTTEKSQIPVPSAAVAAAAAAANGFTPKEASEVEGFPTSRPNTRGAAHVAITPKPDTLSSRTAHNTSDQGAAKPEGFTNPPNSYFPKQAVLQNTPKKGNSKTSSDIKPRTQSVTPINGVADQAKGMFSRKPRNSRTAPAPFPAAPLYPKAVDASVGPDSWEGRKPFPYPPGPQQLPPNPYYMDYMNQKRQVYQVPIKPIPPPLVRSQSLPMYRNQKGRQPIPMPPRQVATAPYRYPGETQGEPMEYYGNQPMVSPMDAQYNPHFYPPNQASPVIAPSENDHSMGFQNAPGFNDGYFAELGPEAQSMNQPAWNWKYRMPFEPPAIPGSGQNLSPPEMKKRRPTSMSLPFYGLGEPSYFGDMNSPRHSSCYSGVSTASSSNSDLSYSANRCTTPSRSRSRIRSNTQPSHRARQPSIRLQMDDSSSAAQLIVIDDDEN